VLKNEEVRVSPRPAWLLLVKVPKSKEFEEWRVLSGDYFLKFLNSGLLLEEETRDTYGII